MYVRIKVETVETAHIKADKTFRLLVEEQPGQGRMEDGGAVGPIEGFVELALPE